MKSWENFLSKLLAKTFKEEILEEALLRKVNFRKKELNSLHKDAKRIQYSKANLEKLRYEFREIRERRIVAEQEVKKDITEINKLIEEIKNL